MKSIQLPYIFMVFLLIQSCKKVEIAPTPSESPVFFAQIHVDGFDRRLEAGRDSYYQYADYYLDTNDVYVFKSLLKKDNLCTTNCQESLQIEIRNNTKSNGQLPNLAQALKTGFYHFAQAEDTVSSSYQYEFTGSLLGTNQILQKSYNWHFSDEIDTTTLNLSAEKITFSLPNTPLFKAQLDVTDAFGAKGSTIIQVLPNSFTGISMNISGNASTPIITATKAPLGNTILDMTWTSGTTGPEEPLSPSHPYGTYCVSGKDSNGYLATTCGEYALLFGQNVFCTAQINYSKEKILHYDQLWLSAIHIIYTDSFGEKWSSFSTPQTNSTFEVIDIKDHKKNEIGLKTKLITAQFVANITNNSNQIKQISGKATFSIGIPE